MPKFIKITPDMIYEIEDYKTDPDYTSMEDHLGCHFRFPKTRERDEYKLSMMRDGGPHFFNVLATTLYNKMSGVTPSDNDNDHLYGVVYFVSSNDEGNIDFKMDDIIYIMNKLDIYCELIPRDY